MPEVNLIRDTQSPELPPRKPRAPGEPELTDPSQGGGLSRFFRNLRGRPAATPPVAPSASRMGLGKSRPDQRIINEKRSNAKPAVIPLPDADEGGFDVNLLSEDLVTQFRPRQVLLALTAWVMGGVALVGLAYLGLSVAERSINSRIASSQEELADVKAEIASLATQQQEIIDTTKKITGIRGLIERHIYWTKFFALLESYTLPQVFYGTAFAGDIQGEFTIEARTDSYDSVAAQYLVYEQAKAAGDFLRDFSITSAARAVSTEGAAVTFTIDFSVLPSVFLRDELGEESPADGSTALIADFEIVVCVVQSDATVLATLPEPDQASVQSLVAQASCSSIAAADLLRVETSLRTDQDLDGLNALYESSIGTLDSTFDSDGDGVNDLTEYLNLSQ